MTSRDGGSALWIALLAALVLVNGGAWLVRPRHAGSVHRWLHASDAKVGLSSCLPC